MSDYGHWWYLLTVVKDRTDGWKQAICLKHLVSSLLIWHRCMANYNKYPSDVCFLVAKMVVSRLSILKTFRNSTIWIYCSFEVLCWANEKMDCYRLLILEIEFLQQETPLVSGYSHGSCSQSAVMDLGVCEGKTVLVRWCLRFCCFLNCWHRHHGGRAVEGKNCWLLELKRGKKPVLFENSLMK